MASSNETNVLKLPQFVGADKPSWLGDFNSAMLKIDTGVGENIGKITSVETVANAAKATADSASAAATALGSEVSRIAGEQDAQGSEIEALQNDVANTVKAGQVRVGTVYKISSIDTREADTVNVLSDSKGVLTVIGRGVNFGNNPTEYPYIISMTMGTRNGNTAWFNSGVATVYIIGGMKGNPFNLPATPPGATIETLKVYELGNYSSDYDLGVVYISSIDTTLILTDKEVTTGSFHIHMAGSFSTANYYVVSSLINIKNNFQNVQSSTFIQALYDQD